MIKRLLSLALQLVLSTAILAAGIVGFRALGEKPAPAQEPAGEAIVPLVETVEVTPHTDTVDIEASGLVVPLRKVTLSAEVAGRITSRASDCRVGRHVVAGTVLFTIDDRDYTNEIRSLEQTVAEADAQLAELDVEAENTRALLSLTEEQVALAGRELSRLRNLAGRQVVSQSEVEQAERAELTARNAVRVQRNQLAMTSSRRRRIEIGRQRTEIQIEQARLQLERTEVLCPVDGIVVEADVESGAWVNRGTRLVTIEDTSKAEIVCNLRIEELALLEHGRERPGGYQLPPTPVTVANEAGGQLHEWAGRLDRYDGSGVESRTRTVPCRIVVDDPLGDPSSGGPAFLMTGLYVKLRIHAPARPGIVRVPAGAVRPGPVVWRVGDGRLEIVAVDVVRWVDDWALLRSGEGPGALAAGQPIVTSPLALAREGMSIRRDSTDGEPRR